ncbi:MAG: secretory carrier-associated membrane protein [Clostridiales bacterium]|nr:secretory carrier-associated membrane protein [Clostridiales bacterium]
MKKLRLMSMIVFVPIVLGIGLLIGGSFTDNPTAASIGGLVLSAGIPVTMFVLVVVGLVLLITGKIDLSDDKKSSGGGSAVSNEQQSTDDEDDWEDVNDDESVGVKTSNAMDDISDDEDDWEDIDDYDEQKDVGGGEDSISGARQKEYKQLADINTSRGYASKIKQAEYIARNSADAYKNSSGKEKVFGWLFFGFLITDFFMIMVFAFIGIFAGAIVCFCLFSGTILIGLLVTVIRQKISMSVGRKHKNRDMLDGVVKLCSVSSTTSTGSRTVRINKVVYKVTITAGENEYVAYTEDYYDRGEKIKFCKIGKHLASIMDEDKLEQLSELEDDDEPLD